MFASDVDLSPSNTLNVILETDEQRAKAFCAVLNSVAFHSQFFLLKEEPTGRHVDIRFYDLAEMYLLPDDRSISRLASVHEEYQHREFPSLREQLDQNFDQRYQDFWEERRDDSTRSLFADQLDEAIEPSSLRLEFDLAVVDALGLSAGEQEPSNFIEQS